MTVKEASIKFKLSEREIRKRKDDGMIINVRKEGRRIVIPDNTNIIPSKKEIQAFLFQIIKFKNNNSIPISRNLCPDCIHLKILMEYLYLRGFIGEYIFNDNIKTLLSNITLTDDGINYIIGTNMLNRLSEYITSTINLNPNIKLSLISVG